MEELLQVKPENLDRKRGAIDILDHLTKLQTKDRSAFETELMAWAKEEDKNGRS